MPSLSATKAHLLTDFARDLSTCTADEIRSRWNSVERQAIDGIAAEVGEAGFEAQLVDHNPVYYLAGKVFFDNDPSLLWAPLHRDIMAKALLDWALERHSGDAGLNILVQRESYKTAFDHGVFPLFVSLRAKHIERRDIRIMLLHHKEQQASLNLQKLNAKTVQSEWMKAIWPEFCAETEYGTKLSFDWPCKKQGVFSEPSVLAGGMGARMTGFHFDWMLYSDPVTEDHIDSKVLRDEALARYQASRFMLDAKTGKEVIDGTRYHPFDLHHHNLNAVVDGKPLYRNIVIAAITDKEALKEFLLGTIDLDRTDGLSFPTRHSYRFLKQKRDEEMARTSRDALWWLQMMNEVRSEGRIVAKAEWFKRIPMREVGQGWRVIVIDPAWKGTTNWGEGDFASIQAWNLERRGSVILRTLLDGVHSNELTSKSGEDEVFRLMGQYGIIDVAPEERGGYVFSTNLLNSAASHGLPINIIKLKSQTTAFDARVGALLKEAEGGRVFISEECNKALAFALLDQVAEYQGPDSLPHDDAIDCAAYSCDTAIAEAYAPRFNRRSALPFWLQPNREPERQLTRYQGV